MSVEIEETVVAADPAVDPHAAVAEPAPPDAADGAEPAPPAAAVAEPAPPAAADRAEASEGGAPASFRGAVDVDVLEFARGAIGGVRANDVAARMSVVGGIAAGHASVEMGMVSGIAAREATVQQGLVRGILAQDVHVEQALVQSVVANHVEAGPTTAIFVAVARHIDGEARILLDWRGALAFGVVLAALMGALRLRRRRS